VSASQLIQRGRTESQSEDAGATRKSLIKPLPNNVANAFDKLQHVVMAATPISEALLNHSHKCDYEPDVVTSTSILE
jgi:hypothetical protein